MTGHCCACERVCHHITPPTYCGHHGAVSLDSTPLEPASLRWVPPAPLGPTENDRWWQVFASSCGSPWGVSDAERIRIAADMADAALEEARKRGRL